MALPGSFALSSRSASSSCEMASLKCAAHMAPTPSRCWAPVRWQRRRKMSRSVSVSRRMCMYNNNMYIRCLHSSFLECGATSTPPSKYLCVFHLVCLDSCAKTGYRPHTELRHTPLARQQQQQQPLLQVRCHSTIQSSSPLQCGAVGYEYTSNKLSCGGRGVE